MSNDEGAAAAKKKDWKYYLPLIVVLVLGMSLYAFIRLSKNPLVVPMAVFALIVIGLIRFVLAVRRG